jgi:hypothetical protein
MMSQLFTYCENKYSFLTPNFIHQFQDVDTLFELQVS